MHILLSVGLWYVFTVSYHGLMVTLCCIVFVLCCLGLRSVMLLKTSVD